MQRSSTRRKGASSPAWVALMLVGFAGGAAACSGEAQVTTELEDELAAEPGGSSPSATPPAAMSPAPQEPARNIREGRPTPSGLSGGRMGTSPSSEAPAAPVPASAEVPDSGYCAPVSDWEPEWVAFEEEVLRLVNEKRSEPQDCGELGDFDAAGPVVMDPILRCSARLHSVDMFVRDFFDHDNPDGKDPFERMSAAGFKGSGAGENIAVGQISPKQVMQSWMDSDGHCANVMRGNFALLGVGYHPGAGMRGLGSNFWTQNFGARPCSRNCR